LEVVTVTAPVEVISGQQIQLSWTIRNRGTRDASGTWNDHVYLSTDAAVGNDQFLQAFSFTGTIPAGGSVTRTQAVTIPITLSGDRWFVVRADANNALFELNEDNNAAVSTRPISIRLAPFPNLRVTAVTVPPTAFSSQQTVIEWTVTNSG